MKVKDLQLKNLQDRRLKKNVIATQKAVILDDDVTFRCRKCNVVACQAHDIRRVRESHYVILNSDVRDSKVIRSSFTLFSLLTFKLLIFKPVAPQVCSI